MITKNDISLASASDAAIVGFNVKLDNGVQGLAKHHGVRILQHTIIYEVIDQVEEAMADLLDVRKHASASSVLPKCGHCSILARIAWLLAA
jgi:translation initiation factor IF-2